MLLCLTSNSLQTTTKTEGDRGSTRLLEKKQEELSRDQTSEVIAFITLEVHCNLVITLMMGAK